MAHIRERELREAGHFRRGLQSLIRRPVDKQKVLEQFRSLEMMAVELDSYGEDEWAQDLLDTVDELLAELDLESDYQDRFYPQGQQ